MPFDQSRRSALLRLRVSLSDTLSLIDQGLPGLAQVVLPSASECDSPLDADTRQRREHLRSDYAHIGGRGLSNERTDAFLSPWWQDTYRPGDTSEMFIGYCAGQIKLRRQLRQPCYFVGACRAGQAWPQIQLMKRQEAGAGCFLTGRYVKEKRNWSDWSLCLLSSDFAPSGNSPVVLTERGIVVRLPETLEASQFEAAMTAQIRKGSLAAWLRTEEGLRHCAFLGVDPALGARFTSAPIGSGTEPQPVENIVIRSQQAAQDRLIAIAERTVLSHLKQRCPEAA